MKDDLKVNEKEKISVTDQFYLMALSLAVFLINVQPRFLSVIPFTSTNALHYHMTRFVESVVLITTLILIFSGYIVIRCVNKLRFSRRVVAMIAITLMLSMTSSLFCDLVFILKQSYINSGESAFNKRIIQYLYQNSGYYSFLTLLVAASCFIKKRIYPDISNIKKTNLASRQKILWVLISAQLISFIFYYALLLINFGLYEKSIFPYFVDIPHALTTALSILNAGINLVLLGFLIAQHKRKQLKFNSYKKVASLFVLINSVAFLFQLLYLFFPLKIVSIRTGLSSHQLMMPLIEHVEKNAMGFISAIVLFFLSICLQKYTIKQKALAIDENEETSGQFGSAQWANDEDLSAWNAFDKAKGILAGVDAIGHSIYMPISNKLTIAPQGLGKTTSSTIPVLLTHKGPVFVFDTKGELWAVTARYRSEVLGKKIIVIDPFRVTESESFKQGKSEELLKRHTINPFDWIPEDPLERDRMINTFAASLVINEKGFSTHFDENAKILIRGFIDYVMRKFEPKDRKLQLLYQLMCESTEEATLTLEQMAMLEGRAQAAANQINRVGPDERGSILSTTYRQIDWIGDLNVQKTLLESNFNLKDFLKGDMDIYVILPEDQTHEHSRLFRMIMCLLMTLISQADPRDLPKQKILFLFEELAQLGATPDVEKCIEVLRARGVVIWAVFQTQDQINMFSKPHLFKTMATKQIFTNDEPETMKWIQDLGGEKTILTKSLSTNSGDSRQWMQINRGSSSTGEGESIHETGVKLIHLNEIRELSIDEQYIFIQAKKPIKCKKARYFEHPDFIGRFDDNPLESWKAHEKD